MTYIIGEGNSSFGRYELGLLLDAGGMGEVYLAKGTSLDRLVALKILSPEFASDAQRMKRFIQEARLASSLNHPNILTIYEVGSAGGAHFIAAEYVVRRAIRAARPAFLAHPRV